MGTFKDLTGERFGKLVVESIHSRGNGVRWLCRCDCGGQTVIRSSPLVAKTRSCGCLIKDSCKRLFTKHGLTNTPLHGIWCQITQRCTNPSNPAFPNYGGRGIKMDEGWQASFVAFRDAVGDRPTPKHTIDRIDNDGPYAPGNVRWVSREVQARNRRTNRLITANGITRTLAEWIALSGLAATTVERRLKRGWPPQEAVTSSAHHRRLRK
jgi:hypothetical protein